MYCMEFDAANYRGFVNSTQLKFQWITCQQIPPGTCEIHSTNNSTDTTKRAIYIIQLHHQLVSLHGGAIVGNNMKIWY